MPTAKTHARHQRPPASAPKAKRSVNVPLLCGTVVGLVVLAIGSSAWIRFQQHRTADAILARALELEANARWRPAAGYLFRYLELRPQDHGARVRLARAFDRSANTARAKPRAIELYYQALGVAAPPEQAALRVRLAELLMEQARYVEVEVEARKLLGSPAEREGRRLLALAMLQQYRNGQRSATRQNNSPVGAAFEEAVAANPKDVELALAWAGILRAEPHLLSKEQREELKSGEARATEANSVIDRLVQGDSENSQVWLARFRYRQEHGLLGGDDDLQVAVRIAPQDASVLRTAAQHYHQKADRVRTGAEASGEPSGDISAFEDLAIRYYQQAIEHEEQPNETSFIGLGDVYIAQGKSAQAIELWQEASAKLDSGLPALALDWRLAQHMIASNMLPEAEGALDRLDERGRALSPDFERKVRDSWDRRITLLRAAWLLKKKLPLEVIPLVKPIASSGQSDPDEQFQAWYSLGDSYTAIAQSDQAATAYENAASLKATSWRARLAAAQAWLNSRQPVKAITLLQQTARLNRSVEVILLLGRARLVHQASLPSRRRDWRAFERDLETVSHPDSMAQLSEPWRVVLLRADSLGIRAEETESGGSSFVEASNVLAEAERDYADTAPFWLELVMRYERMGQTQNADRALGVCRRLAPGTETSLTASRLYAARNQWELAKTHLKEAIGEAAANQQETLRRTLIQIHFAAGELKEGRQGLSTLDQAHPSKLSLTLQLGEHLLESGEFDECRELEEELRELEGAEATLSRYLEARRLLAQVSDSKDPRLSRIVQLQYEISSRRPSWSAGHALAGAIEQAQGDHDRAVNSYQKAIWLGERRVSVYEQLVSLLYRLQRFAEADEYLAQLDTQIPGSEGLSSVAITAAVGRGNLDQAEAFAERGVRTRPNDPMAWIWYGELLLLNDRLPAANQAFHKAVELDSSDVRTWNGLFGYQLKTGDRDAARRTLKQLASQADLTKVQQAFVLAQGYDRLNDRATAEQYYRQAVSLAPESIPIHVRMAAFHLGNNDSQDNRRAEALLRRTLYLAERKSLGSPTIDRARRTLAAMLAARGGEKEFREAMGLLQQTDSTYTDSAVDKRLQAVLITQRANPDLDRAQQLLEELVHTSKTGEEGDHLLLAWVYLRQAESRFDRERQAKQRLAQQQYETLCFRADPKISHMLLYADLLVDLQDWSNADRWLNRLEQADPDNRQVIFLRARSLGAQHRSEEIQPLIEAYAKRVEATVADEQERVDLYLQLGQTCKEVKLHSAAESWYRQAVAIASKHYVKLASSLVAQGRTEAALQLCLQHAEEVESPRPAAVLAAVAASGQVSDQQLQEVEPILATALKQYPEDADLVLAVANLRATQHRTEDAVGLYERVLSLSPRNAVALNNLAMVFSEDLNEGRIALQLIDRAISLNGPLAPLLDTKGMILVLDNRPEQAVNLLRQAAASGEPDPRYHFHLAVALQRIGEFERARAALATAFDSDLKKHDLTDMDERLLVELQKVLQDS